MRAPKLPDFALLAVLTQTVGFNLDGETVDLPYKT